eukprot:m.61763 g.61763  ORF g.61763 m.61763 type:complete len:81 (-) comp9577_c0_seq2:48-290(-)
MASAWWQVDNATTSVATELKLALEKEDGLSREDLDACVGKISRQIDESTVGWTRLTGCCFPPIPLTDLSRKWCPLLKFWN